MQLWGEFGLIHWLIVLAIIVLLFGGRIPKFPGGRKPPTHPLPVTSPLETSKPSVLPKKGALLWENSARFTGSSS